MSITALKIIEQTWKKLTCNIVEMTKNIDHKNYIDSLKKVCIENKYELVATPLASSS